MVCQSNSMKLLYEREKNEAVLQRGNVSVTFQHCYCCHFLYLFAWCTYKGPADVGLKDTKYIAAEVKQHLLDKNTASHAQYHKQSKQRTPSTLPG